MIAHLLVVFCSVTATEAVNSVVHTNVGHIRGLRMMVRVAGKSEHLVAFRGIPYAEPSVGALRFQKPVPKAPFPSTLDATKEGPACLQLRDPFQVSNTTYSEDCLVLNLYVPDATNAKDKLPVMIWIHGGGFYLGSSNVYVGDALSTFGQVIVVTINYRLTAYGFFSSGDARVPGNYGLWDQQLAIKWVHDNIAAFGGDPGRVTLIGQSSGGLSCLLQGLYPPNEGLFQRLIIESGGSFHEGSVIHKPNPRPLARAVGCPYDARMVACLRNKTADEIEKVLTDPSFDIVSATIAPVVDGDFIIASPEELLSGKNMSTGTPLKFFASLDILEGVNSIDGAVFIATVLLRVVRQTDVGKLVVPRSLYTNTIIPLMVNTGFQSRNKASLQMIDKLVAFEYTNWINPSDVKGTRQQILRLASDFMFFVPCYKTIAVHSSLSGGSSYLYNFTTDPTVKSLLPKLPWKRGANHGDEILFVFGFSERMMRKGGLPCCASPEELQLSKTIMTLWTNFAKTGDPNQPRDVTSLTNTSWPQFNVTSKANLELSNQMSPDSVRHNFAAEAVAFWLDLVPAVLNASCHQPVTPLPISPASELVG